MSGWLVVDQRYRDTGTSEYYEARAPLNTQGLTASIGDGTSLFANHKQRPNQVMGFFNKSRSKPEPTKLHRELASWILESAKAATDRVLKAMMGRTPLPQHAALGAFADFAFFNYHWIDRVAFQELGPRRDHFMDALHDEFLTCFVQAVTNSRLPDPIRARVADGFRQQLADFMHTFGKYALSPPNKGTPQGTLLYEFAKCLAVELGCPNDASVIGAASIEAAGLLRQIDVRKSLSQFM
jgi:hypothetical protein